MEVKDFFTTFATKKISTELVKHYYLAIILIVAVLTSCDFTGSKLTDNDPSDSFKIQRYDRVESRYLTTGDFAALQEMNTTYPTETRALIEDLLKLGSVSEENIDKKLLDFYQDSTLQNVIYAVETQYADMTELNAELKQAFVKLKKELPHIEIPTFYSQIGAFDQSIIVDDKSIGISLDKYLGSDYPTYKRFYDTWQRQSMTSEYIVNDCVVFFLLSQYPLENFDNRPQYERDIHLAKFLWIANTVTGKHLQDTPYVNKIDSYMKKHSEKSIADLLVMPNNTQFN